MNNFIYVFSQDDKESLIKKGYTILKEDYLNNVFIFLNRNSFSFDKSIEYVTSDVLTF